MNRYDESREQIEFFRRAAARRYLSGSLRDYVAAIPNAGIAGGRRAMLAGVRRKAEGVLAGYPDIECMVAVAPYTGLHIEMKKSKKDGGKPSDVSAAQKEVMARLTKCGRKCTVAFGADEAWAQLLEYLKL